MQSKREVVGADSAPGHASTTRPAPFAIFPHEPLPPRLLTRVDRNCDRGFYGPFDAQLLASQAAAYIHSSSDANEELLLQVMHKFLSLAQEDCMAEAAAAGSARPQATHSCWLCIRLGVPTDAWVVPRWHTDGRMFDCKCPEPKMPHSKYGFTILGPSTRVMEPNPAVTSILETGSETGRPWDQNSPDPELAKRLSEYPQATIELGQVIRFSWGQQDSPVHSEPDSTDLDRVFITILFGSEDEVRDMCDFREDEYGIWY
ncbi:hypothetical protein B0T10DRAFT_502333 [Thelonectria olida]|uniref:Uncharacterized protein n=1 Tax=Thelonectria olida TaxID=1576542 RepID=A0A9P8VPG7_9HYPO|nr:hypothetical protein B0T10DRAFT_502333 [Thelonectria olida]